VYSTAACWPLLLLLPPLALVKVNFNFEIYLADRKATTYYTGKDVSAPLC